MLLKTILGGAFALVIAASPALACKGTEIFSDDFSSSDGPWQHTDGVNIGGGFAEMKPESGKNAVMVYESQQIKDFDVCADITYPQAKNPDEGGAIGGIIFWLTLDPASFYLMATTPGGMLGTVRVNRGRVLLAAPFRKYNFIKTGAGSKNTFRVTAKGGSVTVYANDQRAAAFRGQADDGFIGLYAESEKDQVNTWKFSNFKLSDPQ